MTTHGHIAWGCCVRGFNMAHENSGTEKKSCGMLVYNWGKQATGKNKDGINKLIKCRQSQKKLQSIQGWTGQSLTTPHWAACGKLQITSWRCPFGGKFSVLQCGQCKTHLGILLINTKICEVHRDNWTNFQSWLLHDSRENGAQTHHGWRRLTGRLERLGQTWFFQNTVHRKKINSLIVVLIGTLIQE